ncbi:MAG: DUF1566 domain-containing protein [Desulfuromonadales bacterium]
MTVKSFCFSIIAVAAAFSVVASAATAASQVVLPQSGQTTCWDSSGAATACAGTGQDGDKLAGTALPATRFTDNGNGTVTDTLTGLIWLKNANCYSYVTWTKALSNVSKLSSGACGLTDGSKAGEWRLPNRKELQSLLNRQQTDNNTWLITSGFLAVQAGTYWTSTTSAESNTYSWSVDFMEASVVLGHKITTSCYVWPVRGGQ